MTHVEAHEPGVAFDKASGEVRPVCAYARCQRPYRPGGRGPSPKRFCSQRCANASWVAAHPRQKALEFTPPAEPLPKLNPTAPKERKGQLQRKCLAILGRLQAGPANNAELLLVGGFRFGARLAELRAAGHCIRTEENKRTGLALYTLDIPAQEAGGEGGISGEPLPEPAVSREAR